MRLKTHISYNEEGIPDIDVDDMCFVADDDIGDQLHQSAETLSAENMEFLLASKFPEQKLLDRLLDGRCFRTEMQLLEYAVNYYTRFNGINFVTSRHDTRNLKKSVTIVHQRSFVCDSCGFRLFRTVIMDNSRARIASFHPIHTCEKSAFIRRFSKLEEKAVRTKRKRDIAKGTPVDPVLGQFVDLDTNCTALEEVLDADADEEEEEDGSELQRNLNVNTDDRTLFVGGLLEKAGGDCRLVSLYLFLTGERRRFTKLSSMFFFRYGLIFFGDQYDQLGLSELSRSSNLVDQIAKFQLWNLVSKHRGLLERLNSAFGTDWTSEVLLSKIVPIVRKSLKSLALWTLFKPASDKGLLSLLTTFDATDRITAYAFDSTRKLVMSTSINDDQRLLLEQASDISVERPTPGSTADSCANPGLSDDESGDTASSDEASMGGEPGYHKPRDDDVRDSTEDDDDAYVLKRSNLSYVQKRQHDRSSYRSGKPTSDDAFIHQIAAFKSANTDDNIGYFFFSVNDPTNSTSFIPILTTDATLIKDPYSSTTSFKYLFSCHVLTADIKSVPIGYMLSSWEESMLSYNVFFKCLRAARGYQFDFDAMGWTSDNHGAIRGGLEVSLPGANTRTERAHNFELLKSNGSAIDNRNIRRLRATTVNTLITGLVDHQYLLIYDHLKCCSLYDGHISTKQSVMLSADIAITDLFRIKVLPNEDGNKCCAVECFDDINLSDFSDVYLEYVKLISPDVSWTSFRSAMYRSLENSKAIVKLGGQFEMQSEDKARKFKVFKSTSCSLYGDSEHFYHCPHVIKVLLNMNPEISKIAKGKRCKVTIKDKTKGAELAGTSTMIERSSDDWSATSMKRTNFTKVLSDYMGIKQLGVLMGFHSSMLYTHQPDAVGFLLYPPDVLSIVGDLTSEKVSSVLGAITTDITDSERVNDSGVPHRRPIDVDQSIADAGRKRRRAEEQSKIAVSLSQG